MSENKSTNPKNEQYCTLLYWYRSVHLSKTLDKNVKTFILKTDTAQQLFNQKWFCNVSDDKIRDQSRCNKTTLYKYIDNKGFNF